MPITGTQKGRTYARLGLMRLGATRLGYFQPVCVITVNGVTRTNNCRIEGISIRDYLDGQPNIATLRVDGFTPVKGQEIKIGMGSLDTAQLVFAGHIQVVNQIYEVQNRLNVAWDLTCVSYEWLLNRRKVNFKYANASASTIAASLITNYTSSFTAAHVQVGLGTIDEISFTNQDVTECLDQLAKRSGAYWYIDAARDLHFFTTNDGIVQPITDGAVHGMRALQVATDLAPVKTRVYVEGGGSSTLIAVTAGATPPHVTIPVEDGSWYNPSGGTVALRTSRVNYSGVGGMSGTGSTVGTPVPTPDVTSMSVTASAGGNLNITTWHTYVTFLTDDGETLPSSDKSVVLTGGNQSISWTSIPTSSHPAVIGRVLYYYLSTSGPFIRQVIPDNTTTTAVDTGTSSTYPRVVDQPLPIANKAGLGATDIAPGSTTLPVVDATNFSASGGWVRVGNQYVYFTSKTGNTLTGIAHSIDGVIGEGTPSDISLGSEIVNVPFLTGVPQSGDGSIKESAPAGEPVNLLVTRNDSTAQTAMAALVGGDGIHEEYIRDGRLSETEAIARGDAKLAEVKDPLVTVRYETTDQGTRSGREVTINLGAPTSVSGTFKIQSVVVSGFSANGAFFPTRQVEASSRRQSFEALLRLLKAA